MVSAVSIVALAAWFLPGWSELFFYDRDRIAGGQGWRLWSGHLAHHSASHLFWNLAVFVPVGGWLERIASREARLFLGFAPLGISAALWWLDPKLQFYAGLSGVTVGVLTLLAFVQLREHSREPGWIWIVVLGLIGTKIVVEFTRSEEALFAGLPNGIRNVPLAHLAGAVAAGAIALATSRRAKGS